MTLRLSPAMRALLTAAAEHPDGRAYNTGQAGFMRTHDALQRRGLLAIVDGSAGVITDEGRAAIGRPLTAEQLAEREAAREAAEAAAVVRAERRAVLVGFGWRPRRGDAVTLADGTRASVGGAFGAAYQCRKCGQSHPFPDVVSARGSVLGAAECELSPTVETAVEYLTVRAADLDAAIAADPGYPANSRWAAEAAQLRAAAEQLAPAPALVVCMFDAKPHPLDDECQRAAPAPAAACPFSDADCMTDGCAVHRRGHCAECDRADRAGTARPHQAAELDTPPAGDCATGDGYPAAVYRDGKPVCVLCAELPPVDLVHEYAGATGDRTLCGGLAGICADGAAVTCPACLAALQRAAVRAEEREQHNAPAAIEQRARNAERVLIAARGLGASSTRSVSVAALKEMVALSDPDFRAALGAHIDAGHIGPVDGWGYSVEWAGARVSAVTLVTGSPTATVVDK